MEKKNVQQIFWFILFYVIFQPRVHETGGMYGNGVIVRRYRTGSVIPVRVELTANHHGYFEFRTCAMTYRDREVTQECLDQHLLRAENGSTRYYPGPGNRVFEGYYKLPEGLTCAQCVFQWRYIAGNNWGDCGNGTGMPILRYFDRGMLYATSLCGYVS